MSTIPSSAMPHAYAHDQEDEKPRERTAPSTGMMIGGAIAAFLLYKVLR
jgi:hypothetical protein